MLPTGGEVLDHQSNLYIRTVGDLYIRTGEKLYEWLVRCGWSSDIMDHRGPVFLNIWSVAQGASRNPVYEVVRGDPQDSVR